LVLPLASNLSAQEAAAIGALVALVPAAGSVIYARKQSRHAEEGVQAAIAQLGSSQNVALGQLLLTFDELLLQFFDIHKALHPRGTPRWTLKTPPSAEEQIRLELYMGLFERMWVLTERGIVPDDIVGRLYRYRVWNLVQNVWVREKKLKEQAAGWTDLLALCDTLEIRID
jgi:hypothetical protein